MALGDYTKTTYVEGGPPGMSPENLNNAEDKIKELDTEVFNHLDDNNAHGIQGKISHSLATAVNDFLVASAAGQFVKKTLVEVKTILGLGSAAYKNFGVAGGVAAYDILDAHKAESASETAKGHIELATQAEVTAGTDTVRAVVSKYLKVELDKKLNSASYTAADVLTKLKTVDGASSGLDADLLDGKHASDFFDISNKPFLPGTYTGDGAASRFINLGFTPSAVLVHDFLGRAYYYNGNGYGGLAVNGSPVKKGTSILEVATNGFNVFYSDAAQIYTNYSNMIFNYIAFK